MKKLLQVLFLFSFFFFHFSLVSAADFGLLLDNSFEASNDTISYAPGLAPWFSLNNGKGLSVYLSAFLSAPYSKAEDEGGWNFIPEVTRFALNYRIKNMFVLEAGRTGYSDMLGFAASGLFDGVRFGVNLPIATINANVFYTGLQYKETAKITMTEFDIENYEDPWSVKKGEGGGYFTSRRLLAGARGDFTFGPIFDLGAEVLTQFDLNKTEDKLNSQYFMLLAGVYPITRLKISAGGALETMQLKGAAPDKALALGALAGINFDLPTKINDQLGVKFKYASKSTEKLGAFTPVSTISQGNVYPGSFSDLIAIGINYNARIIYSLFANAEFNYYIADETKGPEIWASFAFQPLDDLRATLGGGAFIPSGDDPAIWKVSVGLTLSF